MFQELRVILHELYQRLGDRFALQPNPPIQTLQTFSSPNGAVTGSLTTASCNEIDWLVYSWLSNPAMGFNTMRLTVWLSSHIRVPHLAFEFGTVPDLFFYMDYIPRVDLWTDLDYMERYYEAVQPTYLELRTNPNLSLFVSKALYIRLFQSPAHLCYTCPATTDSLTSIRATADAMLERWLGWVEVAEPVTEGDRPALAACDLQMRRISAERDPGNQIAAQILGSELASQLVQALWGNK
jgi:hypothetical protein